MTFARDPSTTTVAPKRADIVAEARTWIGTPYRNQASLKNVGCDCLGLILGVWRKFYGDVPEKVPNYNPNWAEASHQHGTSLMLNACQKYLIAKPLEERKIGDVLLFQMLSRGPIKHMAIMSGPDQIIHAYSGHTTLETALPAAWEKDKLKYAFSFNVEDF